ncbi:MAG: zinc-binding alcohol dehydrogenase [Clostridia bacterium]|nr:zinc-binding alcohol dehydrogenase [Clostridia bacterium]
MSNKNILFTSPCVAELVDKDMPVCGDDEVIVKLEISTISAGTERANLVGDPNVSPKGSVVKFPRQSGYSSSGIVCEVGKDVTSLEIGDRVALSWSKHAEYCAMKESKVHKLDDKISFSEGALLHIGTFPLAAIRKCRLEVGESAIVMGLGVLGLVAVEILRAAGAVPIIAVDPNPAKREQAMTLGADFALDPFEEGFADRVKEITGGGAEVAIEVTGKGQGLDMVLDCMAKFGRVALLGCTRNSDFTIDYYKKVHWPGITLVGAHTMARPKFESFDGWWCERDDVQALMQMLIHKRIDFKSLISETYSPAEAPEVYTKLANNPVFPIVQFDWSRIK